MNKSFFLYSGAQTPLRTFTTGTSVSLDQYSPQLHCTPDPACQPFLQPPSLSQSLGPLSLISQSARKEHPRPSTLLQQRWPLPQSMHQLKVFNRDQIAESPGNPVQTEEAMQYLPCSICKVHHLHILHEENSYKF